MTFKNYNMLNIAITTTFKYPNAFNVTTFKHYNTFKITTNTAFTTFKHSLIHLTLYKLQ